MKDHLPTILLALLFAFESLRENSPAANWPQGPGPNYNLTTESTSTPVSWSAARSENVAWRTPLPETGQSAHTIKEALAFSAP